MNQFKQKIALFLLMVAPIFVCAKQQALEYEDEYFTLGLGVSDKVESFLGKRITGFNKFNPADGVFYIKNTIDAAADVAYRPNPMEGAAVTGRFGLRTKTSWGNPNSVLSTNPATIKQLESVVGEHYHSIPRNLFWMREAWLDLDLAKVLGLPFLNEQHVKLGAFSYTLGKFGLGDEYASGPESLGFYTEDAVDQYAYGLLYDAELIKNRLHGEIYTAILSNKSGSLSETNAKILGQQYGRLNTPARGFGKINFVLTAALDWNVFDQAIIGGRNVGSLNVKPYIIFNRDPEQTVKYVGDASMKLLTSGFELNYEHNEFECSAEFDINTGRQRVYGLDRNQIIQQNREGVVTLVNSHVFKGNPADEGQLLEYVTFSPEQTIVNNSLRSELQNGKTIGIASDDTSLMNSTTRFRDPYTNTLNGWAGMIDAGYWFVDRTLRIAGLVAIASGDEDPNTTSTDSTYSGYVGLQESFSGGDRVRSAFVLGGAGKPPRLFTLPTNEAPDAFVGSNVGGFTNLIIAGSSLLWRPVEYKKPFSINPNILAFWQEKATGNARSFLGVEANVFANCTLLENLEVFSVVSLFVPGSHYKDRKNAPLLDQQQVELADDLDTTGFEADKIPGLSDNVAYTINCGIKFTF